MKPRCALFRLLALGACLTVPLYAAEGGVRVECPELASEPAAEIESRVRASLLSSDSAASVTITCQGERAEVRAESAAGVATVPVTRTRESFRDDVLRAVDEALQQLQARPADAVPPTTTAPEPQQPEPVLPAPIAAPRVSVAKAPPPALPAKSAASHFEIFGSLLTERWPERFALGGSVGVGHATPVFWFAAKLAWLQPTRVPQSFNASELSLGVELGVAPPPLLGIRFALGAGPSFLFITPQGDLMARKDESASSLFLAAQVSRPFWFGRVGVVPALGARYVTSERGVRVDEHEELSLTGFVPQLGVGVAYRAP